MQPPQPRVQAHASNNSARSPASFMADQEEQPKATMSLSVSRAVGKRASAAMTSARSAVNTVVAHIKMPERPAFMEPAPSWPLRDETWGTWCSSEFCSMLLPAQAVLAILVLLWSCSFMACLLLQLLFLVFSVLLVLLPFGMYKVFKHCCCRSKTIMELEDKVREGGDWRSEHEFFFSTATPVSMQRRRATAEDVLSRVGIDEATTLNDFVQSVETIAFYGCGVLAASHVGGLRALERHGLQYDKVHTIAGVSAGSILAATLAIGYNSEELVDLITRLPMHRLLRPELGAVMRALRNLYVRFLSYVVRLMPGGLSLVKMFLPPFTGTGPGLSSGFELGKMVREAVAAKGLREDFTLIEVLNQFKKKILIVCTELDTGKERVLSPDTEPHLPVWVAVRMSMGVPGLMEPFLYENHVYLDGGLVNDFPVNLLPPKNRLGLMVRPSDWYESNTFNRGLDMVTEAEIRQQPEVAEYLTRWNKRMEGGIYPVRDLIQFVIANLNTVMNANLQLQVGDCFQNGHFNMMSLDVIALCGGKLDPFDFGITAQQHYDLYLAGQLCVHLRACRLESDQAVMSVDDRMKTMLHCIHLKYSDRETTRIEAKAHLEMLSTDTLDAERGDRGVAMLRLSTQQTAPR